MNEDPLSVEAGTAGYHGPKGEHHLYGGAFFCFHIGLWDR
jgi:hypothetical protein